MTDAGNGIYTYSYNVTTAGTYYFAFADGHGNGWDDFNDNHRIGPTSGNVEVSLDGTWVNTQKGGGSYFVNVDAGPVTITLDVSSTPMRFNVVGTAPTVTPDYYVVGDGSIFPNGWNTGSETLMTEDNGTYTWTMYNVHLNEGTTYEYKVLGSDNSWHPSGADNATFTVNANGTYNVVFTFDGNNTVNAVPTLQQADPTYQYTFYVYLPNGGTPYLYTWNGDYRPNGAWPGTQLSQTQTLADGNSWYVFTGNYYNNLMSLIVNLGEGNNECANLTNIAPGTYYITWDGGDHTTATITTDAPTPPVYYVVGEDTNIFPNGWNIGSETLMTDNNGTYTWTVNNIHLDAGTTYTYKVLGSNNSSYPANGEASFSVDASGTYNVVFTFDGTNVNAVPTLVQADPIYTYDIYVRYTGNEALSNVYLYAWDAAGTLSAAWSGTALSSLTTQEINGFTYYKVTYTSYASTINVIFNENGSSSTQTANLTANPGNNYFTYGGGSNVTGPTTQPDVPDYYVVGEDINIFPNQWSTGSETLMTLDNGTYTWTASNVHLTAGTYGYKVLGSDGNWYPSGPDNATFTVDANGYYDVVFTFDGTNVNAVPTLIQADQPNTFNIYVRYTGIEDMENVYTHAWDTAGDKTQWPGTSFQSAGYTIINGYRYYTYTFTSYDATLGLLFNENGSSQTADLTATPGDNYFTYGGGSTVDGPNSQADARTDMYLIGYANSQQWAANNGIPMEWDADNNYYKLERVVLTSMSNFAFATQLGATSDDWATVNAHRLSSTGNSNWAITVNQFDTWLKYMDYVEENHNWYVEQAGAYDIYVDPGTRRIMVATRHEDMYISHGVNWTYANDSEQMSSVDGNVYQATITLNNGDYFLFSTELDDASAWGASSESYEITDLMINFAQKLEPGSTNNFYFNGTSGRYIVVVNKAKNTVTLRKTYDATVTKIYLEKTNNVTLNPAGGTYNNQPVEGKRGGIHAWNKLNLESQGNQAYTWAVNRGPTNYTYVDEVGNDYGGDGYLKDLNDTTTLDGKQWYAWSVSNSICEFYFIRSNQTDYKSQNIIRRAGEVWLTWIDEDATFNRQENAQHLDSLMDVTRNYYDVTTSGVSDCATMLEGHYYVYYTNTTGWDSVYCYAWHDDPFIEYNGEYPGSKCTFVGYDNDGYEVWCYDFGLIDEFGKPEPTGIIFDNGRGGANEGQAGDAVRQQTGDLEYDNGACYDYLGMIYLGNSLNAIINGGVVNGPKYTVEDDLIGVYYDNDAITLIRAIDNSGHEVDYYVKGALYAKDMENYSAKSRQPEGTTDYVYDICSHWTSEQYPGGSQVQLKRTYYDQSNWVKIVLSPNFDNTNAKSNADVTIDESQFDTMTYHATENIDEGYLSRYVGKIIPGHSMSGNLVSNVNPQMHITNIARPVATPEYEKNVYITTHFNDTVVFSYTHPEWNPDFYKGVYRTVPHLAVDDETGEYLVDNNGNYFVDYTEVMTDKLYKMYYVAPKPQEIAYITWAVFDHEDPNVGTATCEEPSTPGAFYAPMNWNRTGQLWTDPSQPDAAWGTTYGPFSNGYMQYGAFQVNWSLFGDENHVNDSRQHWYQIFKPGQAYKILALIRYAYGDDLNDVEYTEGVLDENYNGEYHDGGGNHVYNAPRREDYTDVPNMERVPYEHLNKSKFIVFPLMGTAEDSNGSDMGNVTGVKEVQTTRTVTGVYYYNLMGVKSDKPHDGLNIVVTTYSDGSRTSKKILR